MPQSIRAVLIPVAAAIAVSVAIAAVIVVNRPPILVNVRSATTNSSLDTAILASGDATVDKKPDLAIISAGLDAQAGSASAAQRDLATKAAKLIARIKQLGVQDKDLSTSGYWIGPVYGPSGQTVTAYRASEQLQVNWHNVDTVGATLDAIVQQGGATNISVGFGLANPKAAQAEARSLAIGDAKSKAQAMASAAGVQLGQIIRIADSSTSYRPPSPYSFAAGAADKAVTQVPVGNLEIEITVEVDYSIA